MKESGVGNQNFWTNPIAPKIEISSFDEKSWSQVCLADDEIVISFFMINKPMVCISLSNPKAIEMAGSIIRDYRSKTCPVTP